MKYLITSLLACIFLLSCERNLPQSKLINSKEQIRLEVTGSITEPELNGYIESIENESKITVSSEGTVWTGDGQLEKLVLSVDCGDGYQGVATASEEALMLGRVVGFERNYQSDGKPFQIGNL